MAPQTARPVLSDAARDIMAGGCAGMVSILIMYPMDTVRTRLQMAGSQGKTLGVRSCVASTFRNEGIRAFYKGMAFPLAAQVVFKAVIFTTNGIARRALNRRGLADSPAGVYACGALGGGVNSFIVTPVELVRTRLILQYGGKPASSATAGRPAQRGVWHVAGSQGDPDPRLTGHGRLLPGFRHGQEGTGRTSVRQQQRQQRRVVGKAPPGLRSPAGGGLHSRPLLLAGGASFGHDQDGNPGGRAEAGRGHPRRRCHPVPPLPSGRTEKPVHGLAGGVRARDSRGGHHAGDAHVRQPEARRLRGCDHLAPTAAGGGGSGCGGKATHSDEPDELTFFVTGSTGAMLLPKDYGSAARWWFCVPPPPSLREVGGERPVPSFDMGVCFRKQ